MLFEMRFNLIRVMETETKMGNMNFSFKNIGNLGMSIFYNNS